MLFNFVIKSYFYDNGLVNILIYLYRIFQDKWKWNIQSSILQKFKEISFYKKDLDLIHWWVKYDNEYIDLKLYPFKLEIEAASEKLLQDFLKDIFKYLLLNSWIIYFTSNNEFRLNLESGNFEFVSKVNIRGGWSWNDIKHSKEKFLVPFEKILDLESYIKNFYDSLTEDQKKLFWSKSKEFKEIDKTWLKFNKPKKWGLEIELEKWKKVYVEKILRDFTLEEFIDSYISYLVDKDKLIFNSKVNPFEDWQDKFEDLLVNDKSISKIDLLIWQLGQKGQRYFGGNYFFYIYAPDLVRLFAIKNILNIPDIANDNSNFNLSWYIFPNEEYFQLLKILVFIYILLDDTSKREKFLFNNPSVLIYKSGDMKDTLLFFNKINLLFRLFDIWDIKKDSAFKELISFIYNVVRSFYWKTDNMPEFKRIGSCLLGLKPFHRSIADLQNKNLSLDKSQRKILPDSFNYLYCKFLKMIWNDTLISNACKDAWDKIGYFLAKSEKGGEDILFRLRNVKNKSQLLDWLSQVMFMLLKEPEKQMKGTYESIEELIKLLNDTSFEDLKSYLTIYTIQKYLRVLRSIS